MDIAVDFGGTNIKIGLVEDGAIVARSTIPAYSGNGLLPRLPDLERRIRSLLADHQLNVQGCGKVGLAFPGIVDPHKKQVTSINKKYDDAVGFSFEHWVDETFGLPLVFDNDARVALMGEVGYGAAKGAENAVMMTFGTGIGTAAIMNGRIVYGKHFQAGILGGHLIVKAEGDLCTCGNIGCLEAESSHWAIPYQAKQIAGFTQSELARQPIIDYKTVVDCSKSGDLAATQLLEQLIVYWTAGMVNMIHAYDPEVMILSGGLMNASDLLLERFKERVNRLAWTSWGSVQFVVAENPNASVLLGLSYLMSHPT